MGNGNIEVGKQTPTRKPGQPAVERTSGRNGSSEQRIASSLKQDSLKRDSLKAEHPCGAMSQQGDEFHGNLSSPQKFVHLVGCREPKVVKDAGISRYSNPANR